MNRRTFIIGAGSAVLATPFVTRVARSATGADLDASIARFAESKDIAGVSACAMNGDKVLWRGAGGWADISRGIPMTPDTIQNIGSISKTVTATAVMQLVESDRLALDEDINRYLPFPIRNPRNEEIPITVRHLLVHQSSIIDGPAYDASYACGDPTVSLKDWIASVLTPEGEYYHRNRYFWSKAPGERRRYSNIGYGVLGLIVESVTGRPFEEYCREHIFAPLGMTNTGWRIDSIDQSTHAIPYDLPGVGRDDARGLVLRDLADEGFSELCLYSFANYPDGLVRTSANQLGRFMSAYLSDSLLQPSTIERMLQEEVRIGETSVQGLCWVTRDTPRGRTWYHSGGDPGISTIAVFERDTKAIAVILTTGPGDDGMVDLLDEMLAHARQG